MDFNQLVDQTRTFHAFKAEAVPEDAILEALENSLKAPNHKLSFPWKYIWIRGEKKQAVAELAFKLKCGDKEVDEDKKRAVMSKFLNPELVLFCQRLSDDDFRRKEDYATLSCSVQLFALSLANRGFGYKWSTGGAIREQMTYELFNLNPKEFEIIGLIMAGRPVTQAKQRLRPQLSEVLERSGEV